jgi:hypothetical protein
MPELDIPELDAIGWPSTIGSEFLYLVKAAPPGPLGLMPCVPAALARGVRLAPVPRATAGTRQAGYIGAAVQENALAGRAGSEMAGTARTLPPCVA